ncbi:MAG: DegV family protein [Anaerolineae bacterium]|nr:DegV family protein [Anaerolineae bacterium]
MSSIRVVVDSAADFAVPTLPQRYGMTIVPGRISFGSEVYMDGAPMHAEAFFKRASREDVTPRALPPSVEDYEAVFGRLAQSTDQILSLHTSAHLNASWQNAKAAAQSFLGRCDIAVIDSQTTTAGLGMLAEHAARAAEKIDTLDTLVRQVRGTIGRIYSIFYVDSLTYIKENAILSEAQAILGTMLGIKPFLTIEEGHLITMEKVRTRTQAIDKLVEFVLEFTQVEQLVILQSSPFVGEGVRQLTERLNLELGKREWPIILYGPTLACLLGMEATGLAVMESSEELP